ncbi:unnamed protein product [Rhizoctonia solani]|uniref:Ricin B lectin domain-containing protein n=1 Tax=Rhizoctonia solani TaxID=456999 RepID=A0A8H3DLD9_9AGAM|nr:unnamed protein product [Rhizoctonia solani]CAE6533010.1 unnamed protein product [Rhizoctonia solani]
MKPGTYRIVNLASGTAITEIGPGEVASRPVDYDSKTQQWFAQHSGDGYQFKSLKSGGYLAIASINDHNGELYSSGYPTSWMLFPNPEHRGHNTYGILMGDTDLILDLADGPKRADKTKASLLSTI